MLFSSFVSLSSTFPCFISLSLIIIITTPPLAHSLLLCPPCFQEDDGLRMRKSNMMSSQHPSVGMKKEEGLGARTVALIMLFFVLGVIVGKLVL